jgi:carbonic anhydrase/acetyltransferase-like protein (isoleucine patch superfamily)
VLGDNHGLEKRTAMIYTLGDRVPQLIGEGHYVADSAQVIGSVVLHANTTVLFGAVVRGDCEIITIGEGSNIQDLVLVHADFGVPVVVGKNVTVGHQVCLHGCTIGDGALIGIHATVLNGAVIGEGSLVGANSLVGEGKVFPPRSLILGSPAKWVRELTDEDVARVANGALHYTEMGKLYRTQLKVMA